MSGLAQIEQAAQSLGLRVAGSVPKGSAPMPGDLRSIVLLSPDEPAFWPHFTQSPEYRDGQPDPMDRWSFRVIRALAEELGAEALFPFGTVPPHPFYTWALASGQVWSSPVQFLVGARSGLWASFRGALGFARAVGPLPPREKPCEACAKPCATACPVGALTPAGYDVDSCHAYLDSDAGQDCMTNGCAVRRACPISAAFGRDPAQSAFHMRHFHK
ncbi:MAG: ferredoxin [Rhodobacteraceae bacterium]|nr:ferredoxin [Paracoccaceae bacterium]